MKKTSMEILHSTNLYTLRGQISGADQLLLDLQCLDQGFVVRSFCGVFQLTDLPHYVQISFQTLENVKSYMSDSNSCKVNVEDGKICLRSIVRLNNGTTMELPTGQIQLNPYTHEKSQELQEILTALDTQQTDLKIVLKKMTNAISQLTDQIHSLKSQNKQQVLQTERVPPKVMEKSMISIPKMTEIDLPSPVSNKQMKISSSVNSEKKKEKEEESEYVEKFGREIKENISILSERVLRLETKYEEIFKSSILQKSKKSQRSYDKRSVKSNEEGLGPNAINQCQKPAIIVSPPNSTNTKIIQYEESPRKRNRTISDFNLKDVVGQQNLTSHIDMNATYINQFLVIGNLATYTGQDWTKTQLLGSVSISKESQFKIKIKKTKRRYIWLGVADASYNNRRWSWGYPNWVYYCGWNGKIYEGPDKNIKIEGTGFKEGETITVKVDLSVGLISWMVGDSIRARHTTQKLLTQQVNWVPLIKFFDTGDTVEWISDRPK